MEGYVERIVENIDFTMKMENMPLTEADKSRLRNCITGRDNLHTILQETIKKHTRVKT